MTPSTSMHPDPEEEEVDDGFIFDMGRPMSLAFNSTG
jgi:hypothetical protein